MNQALHDMQVHRGGAINLVIPTALGRADFLRRREELPAEVLEGALAELAAFRPPQRWAPALAA